jgi:hypothetical protein
MRFARRRKPASKRVITLSEKTAITRAAGQIGFDPDPETMRRGRPEEAGMGGSP